MKVGLALEGGGAKGAYQVGVYKALIENSYNFDYIVGTSIGAINGAMMVQDDLDLLIKLWSNISYSSIIEVDDETFETFIKEKLTLTNLADKLGFVRELIKNKGFSTSSIKRLLLNFIDEDRVRASNISFGLSTINLSQLKFEELFIDKIPRGKLVDYIMASSNLPVFQQENQEEEERYLDGGLYKNNPYEMLVDKCDKIVCILMYDKISYRELYNNPKLELIQTNEKLVDLFDFNGEDARYNIKLGYFDGLRHIKSYQGKHYYIEPIKQEEAFKILQQAYYILVDQRSETRLIKDIHDIVSSRTELDYIKILINRIEFLAKEKQVERFELYTLRELAKIIKDDWNRKTGSILDPLDKILIEAILK